jgi:hypothetical protein
MEVAILTLEQQNQLYNQELEPNWYFNPFMDQSFNWVISSEEIYSCTNSGYQWVKDLELVDYEPITYYEFLQFLDYEDAVNKLLELSDCLDNLIVQYEPFSIYDNDFSLLGYAIIATPDVRDCLTLTELANILTATTTNIIININ